MKTKITSGPAFIYDALLGLGLSYGLTSDMSIETLIKCTNVSNKLFVVAKKLAWQQGGHNKFLETITLCLDIKAPRYWWQEFDTYRVGVTKQSESTIHTIMQKEFTQDDFQGVTEPAIIRIMNTYRREYLEVIARDANNPYMLRDLKNILPEGYLQRRIVTLNLKTLQNMYVQRKDHKLREWHWFFDGIKSDLEVSPYYDFVMWCLFKEETEEM